MTEYHESTHRDIGQKSQKDSLKVTILNNTPLFTSSCDILKAKHPDSCKTRGQNVSKTRPSHCKYNNYPQKKQTPNRLIYIKYHHKDINGKPCQDESNRILTRL